ncbi:MAG: hypothetical protein H6R45_1276, partial [Proteobacteria bacterium]|nr:hypothetical protein [Pseudomonadota bacterium]
MTVLPGAWHLFFRGFRDVKFSPANGAKTRVLTRRNAPL